VKIIPLTRGYKTLVDDEDYEYLSQFKWRSQIDRYVYAVCTINGDFQYLHHLLLLPKIGFIVDHKDRNSLNNQKSNLRYATYSQNNINTNRLTRSSSGYRGVSFHKQSKKWSADICLNYERTRLGLYDTPEMAAVAYNIAARELHGEFARLNVV
jgi:hypothetical protein